MSPPKYHCSSCGKGFKHRKQHDDHILFNRCKGMKGTKKQKGNVPQLQAIDPELQSLKLPFEYPELSQPNQPEYYGRPYDFNPIPTGNRHFRCGIPFATDPLRRNITRVQYKQNMEKIGPSPTLSKNKYRKAAI